MTVQTDTNVASFNGDGANKVFPIGYKFNSAADLVVLLVDDVAVTTQVLTLNSDFTVTGAGDEEGGTVTLEVAPTANQRLTIIRIVDILQLTDLRNQGKFYAEIHEDAFDLLTMIAQQHQTDIDRSLRVAETDPEPARIPSAAQRAGKLLAFDASGNPTTALPVADSSTELRQDLADPSGGATLIATPSGGVVADVFSEDAQKGSALIPYRSSAATPSSQTIKDKLDQFELPADSLGGKAGAVLRVLEGNWPAATGSGGRSYFFNPDSVDTAAFSKNSVVVLGGRGPSYLVTVGANAELAFHGGGGDTLLDHLAGTVCGGAHHKMTKNNADTPTGSHGFIGGGSYQEVYGDYALAVGGTGNKSYALKASILGGDANRIGNITDQLIGRNSFIGGGYLNTIDGTYAWIPGGRRCKAQKDYSGALGYQATSNHYGVVAQSSGAFSVDGDNNTLRGKLRRVTTDGIATQLLLDGSSQGLVMGSNTLWTGRVLISALRTDTLETASYSITFSAYCSDGVATIKSQALTVLHEDNTSFNVDVAASGATVSIRGTGVDASNVRWSASFEIDELRNI